MSASLSVFIPLLMEADLTLCRNSIRTVNVALMICFELSAFLRIFEGEPPSDLGELINACAEHTQLLAGRHI